MNNKNLELNIKTIILQNETDFLNCFCSYKRSYILDYEIIGDEFVFTVLDNNGETCDITIPLNDVVNWIKKKEL